MSEFELYDFVMLIIVSFVLLFKALYLLLVELTKPKSMSENKIMKFDMNDVYAKGHIVFDPRSITVHMLGYGSFPRVIIPLRDLKEEYPEPITSEVLANDQCLYNKILEIAYHRYKFKN